MKRIQVDDHTNVIRLNVSLNKYAPPLQLNLIAGLRRTLPHLSFDIVSENILVASQNSDSPTFDQMQEVLKQFQIWENGLGQLRERAKSEVIFSFEKQQHQQSSPNTFNNQSVLPTDIPGVSLLSEEAETTAQMLDALFKSFALSLGAKEISIPSLVTKETLIKAGYLPRDQEQIHEIHGSDVCLTPALCLGCYPSWHLWQEVECVTSIGRVFRREAGLFEPEKPLRRLREYRCREIIFLAKPNELQDRFQKIANFLEVLIRTFDMPAVFLSATDLFFHPESGRAAVSQLIQKNKYELQWLGESEPLALGSWNYHQKHFVESFGMYVYKNEIDKNEFESACFGFGIERWVRATMMTIPDRMKRETTIKNILRDLNKFKE